MKPESYFVVQGTTLLETDGGCYSVGMCHQAFDIATEVVLRVGIGFDASIVHYFCYHGSSDKREWG
jgi:hypothetical protein